VSAAATPDSHYDAERVTIIRPTRGWMSVDLRELWDYRELLYFLIWRDVKIRYKQTAIGVMWIVLQPVLVAGVFTFIFGHYAHFPMHGVPYLLYAYSAMLPWLLFQNGLTLSTKSIVENQALITKVYVPRLLIPIAPVLGGIVDFLVGSVVLVGLMAIYDYRGLLPPGSLSWRMLTLPLFLLFAVVAAIAVTLWLSALNVKYRDVQYTVPFLAQAWFFATPILWPISLLAGSGLERWLGLNPMTGVVQGFHWALFGSGAGQVGHIMLLSLSVTVVLLAGGVAYFRRVERSFADVV
jgi:lipopolysaccharide transport system permease protein